MNDQRPPMIAADPIDSFHALTSHIETLHMGMELHTFQSQRKAFSQNCHSIRLTWIYGGHADQSQAIPGLWAYDIRHPVIEKKSNH